MAPSFASTSTLVDSAPAPDQPAQEPTVTPAPKKKPRTTALAGPDEPIEDPFGAPTESLTEQQTGAPLEKPVEAAPRTEPALAKRPKKRKLAASKRAKAVLRAAKIPKRRTDADDPESSFDHHRRKCQVCNHPDREAIEELFIGWHSPRSIRIEFGSYHRLDCSSIYRHARAAGLYAKRRKNLRAVFDLILEHAGNIEPTAHGIAAIVRAYSCLTDTHDWIEPERRVHVVNHIYRHDVPASTNKVENDSSFRACPGSSCGAPHPRDVVTSEPARAAAVSGAPSGVSFAGAPRLRQAAQREEVAKGGMPSAPPSPENSAAHAETAPLSEGRSLSLDTKTVEKAPSFRVSHPRGVVASQSTPAPGTEVSRAPSFAPSASGGMSSAPSGPADSQPPSSRAFVGADRFHRPAPSEMADNSRSDASTSTATAPPSGGRSFSSDTQMVEKDSSSRAPHLRDVVSGDSLPASAASHSPAPVLATSHSPLATRTSNRHTPEIRIASNSHKTNNRRISNRHISHPVSTETGNEKSPKTIVASRRDKMDG